MRFNLKKTERQMEWLNKRLETGYQLNQKHISIDYCKIDLIPTMDIILVANYYGYGFYERYESVYRDESRMYKVANFDSIKSIEERLENIFK